MHLKTIVYLISNFNTMKINTLLFTLLALTFFTDANGQWTKGKLSDPRSGLSACVLGSKIYFSGGLKSLPYNASQRIDIYDAEANVWSQDSFSKPYYSVAAKTYENKAYFACTSLNEDNIEILDMATGLWETVKIPLQGGDKSFEIFDDKIYLEGSGNAQIYDINSKTWSSQKLSVYRGNMEILKAGNKVIFAGGNEPNNFISNKVDVFDLTTKTWSTTKLSQERSDIAAITFEGKAYFAGGYRDDYSVTNRIDIYDGNTDTWSIDSMPLARSAMAVEIFKGKIYFAGGRGNNGSGFFKEVQIYDPAKKQWTTSNLSQERHSLAAVAYKDKIFFAGGRKQGGSSDVIDIYQEVGTSTSNLIESESFIEIYPNPCHQNLNLRFDSNFLQGPYDISILNATTGALYYKNTFNVSNGELKLNIENLSSGLHLLVVSNKNNSITKEFVKY